MRDTSAGPEPASHSAMGHLILADKYQLFVSHSGLIKMEAEETDEGGRYAAPLKQEADGGSEDGMEESFEEERPEEDDALNEPQDLSLVDYSRYDGAELPDAAEAAGEGSFAGEGAASRVQTSGKFSCDICGLSCISINVLLVHKRSHTGEHRPPSPPPSARLLLFRSLQHNPPHHWIVKSSLLFCKKTARFDAGG